MTHEEIVEKLVRENKASWSLVVTMAGYPDYKFPALAALTAFDRIHEEMRHESARIVEADLNGTLVAYLKGKEK